MDEREQLIISVANTIKGYRKGQIEEPTTNHVDEWLKQFTSKNQLPFIREFDHVLRKSYITQEKVKLYFSHLIKNYPSPHWDSAYEFWSSACFMNIQLRGQSQCELREVMARCLNQELDVDIRQAALDTNTFIYVDDVIFTGLRLRLDLEEWIKFAPEFCTVYVVTLARHSSSYYVPKRIRNAARELGKNITVCYIDNFVIENRRSKRSESGVLWPSFIPAEEELHDRYDPKNISFPLRRVARKSVEPFSRQDKRSILEEEFLIAGAKIAAKCSDQYWKPLGFSRYEPGFGSVIASYRNCPNNCPLALWWGDGGNSGNAALNWYPLLPRNGY
ncbi:phosphoribosyltransferase-like protein [Bacterioplanoides sp.]|uniref:phosphoribosyltransferase-like protein n=1 Tax=Bacterioplanoides sp. TaxID=2066072 RepID=UPI003B5A3733